MHILIVKLGALGDVVRTSYFAKRLKEKHKKLRLSWITEKNAVPLLESNPYIDDIWTDFKECQEHQFSIIYSLDDEVDTVKLVSGLNTHKIVGAYYDFIKEVVTYDDSAASWFDMGLNSKHGKVWADQAKRENKLSHGKIFSKIFQVEYPEPKIWMCSDVNYEMEAIEDDVPLIGINPYAGGRWASKELQEAELKRLIYYLLEAKDLIGLKGRLVLIGAGDDRLRNLRISQEIDNPRIIIPNTDGSLAILAKVISKLNVLITSDSLALHLAIAQKVPFIAFFSPTSAAEIDDYDLGMKVLSTSADYCSYKKCVDNSSITASRIFDCFTRMVNKLKS